MTAAMTMTDQGWQAYLQLGYDRRGGRTVLSRRRHHGPLAVQKTFHPEGETCHTYILHPPGGVAAGDTLHIDAQLDAHSHALITTPAAGKIYRSDGAVSCLRQRLQVAAGAVVEWLPQENILFSGCRAQTSTDIHLAGDARCLAWETTCFGRPACGERYTQGWLRQSLQLWRDGKPLFIDRQHVVGGEALQQAAWGLDDQPVHGVMLATAMDAALLDSIDESLRPADRHLALSLVGDVFVARYLGPSATDAQLLFRRWWHLLRPLLLQRPACEPRIWHT